MHLYLSQNDMMEGDGSGQVLVSSSITAAPGSIILDSLLLCNSTVYSICISLATGQGPDMYLYLSPV